MVNLYWFYQGLGKKLVFKMLGISIKIKRMIWSMKLIINKFLNRAVKIAFILLMTVTQLMSMKNQKKVKITANKKVALIVKTIIITQKTKIQLTIKKI